MRCMVHRVVPLLAQWRSSLGSSRRHSAAAAAVVRDDVIPPVDDVSDDVPTRDCWLLRRRELHEIPEHVRVARQRHVALWYGYCGAGYHGNALQRCGSPLPSVEHQLFTALWRSFAVLRFSSGQYPLDFSRVSRTDVGVSAVGQCVTLRMSLFDGVVDAINAQLPAGVRVFGYKRVPPSLNLRRYCTSRLYSYTLPTLALAAPDQLATHAYRLSVVDLQHVRRLFGTYVGWHWFHNFSSAGSAGDTHMRRRLFDVTVDPPHVVEDVEFVTVWLHGASFVLNQIRRMVGLVVAVRRGVAPVDAVTHALRSQHQLQASTAPALGLVMERCLFTNIERAAFNRHGSVELPERQPDGGCVPCPVDASGGSESSGESHSSSSLLMPQRALEAFRRDVVMRHVYEQERRAGVMFEYARSLPQCMCGAHDSHGHRSPLYVAQRTAQYWRTVEPMNMHAPDRQSPHWCQQQDGRDQDEEFMHDESDTDDSGDGGHACGPLA